MASINASTLFSLLEKELGQQELAKAMFSYLSSQKAAERPAFLEPTPSSPKAALASPKAALASPKLAAKKPSEAPGAPKKAKKAASAEPEPVPVPAALKPAAKAEKPAEAETEKPKRVLGDGQKAWNAFIFKVAGEKGSETDEYTAWLKKHEGEGLKGNLKMVFAKELRAANESAYEAFAAGFKSSAASVLSDDSLEEKPAKKSSAAGAGAGSDSETEKPAKKVRKPWSDAARAAQSARARARAQAKKEAKAASASASEDELDGDGPLNVPTTLARSASLALPASQDDAEDGAEELMNFEPFSHEGRSLFKNARGDVLTEEMKWVGHFDGKTLDKKAPRPTDLDI